jgi:hypothetical protein
VLWILLAGLTLAALPMQAAMVIDDFSADTNDRFANDQNYIAGQYDLSGAARGQGNRGWATLVSRNVFLSARHLHPEPGHEVWFFPGNDPNASAYDRTVDSGQHIGSTDLWMGVLNNPVPSSIAVYPYATETINDQTDAEGSPYWLESALMFGQSANGRYNSSYRTTNMATGRNKLDLWSSDKNVGNRTGDAWEAIYNDGPPIADPNYVTYESYLMSGDSSGPMFVDLNGVLTLTGINWYRTETQQGDVFSSGFSYVGNYASEIQDFIDNNPVPEPTAALLFAMGVMLIWCWRRP